MDSAFDSPLMIWVRTVAAIGSTANLGVAAWEQDAFRAILWGVCAACWIISLGASLLVHLSAFQGRWRGMED